MAARLNNGNNNNMEKPRNCCFTRASGKPRDPVDMVLTIFRVAAFVISVCLIVIGSTFLQMLPGDGVSSEASIVTIVLVNASVIRIDLSLTEEQKTGFAVLSFRLIGNTLLLERCHGLG
jgi:hypothetical protein